MIIKPSKKTKIVQQGLTKQSSTQQPDKAQTQTKLHLSPGRIAGMKPKASQKKPVPRSNKVIDSDNDEYDAIVDTPPALPKRPEAPRRAAAKTATTKKYVEIDSDSDGDVQDETFEMSD